MDTIFFHIYICSLSQLTKNILAYMIINLQKKKNTNTYRNFINDEFWKHWQKIIKCRRKTPVDKPNGRDIYEIHSTNWIFNQKQIHSNQIKMILNPTKKRLKIQEVPIGNLIMLKHLRSYIHKNWKVVFFTLWGLR